MQQLLFVNPGLIFSDIRCRHRKARGPDAGKQQQVEAGLGKSQGRLSGEGGNFTGS